MINLYWKTKEQTKNLVPKPFDSESKFESYIFDNQDILGDVHIIHRQIRTGSKQGIPDMLGVDQDARVCIIEMKNDTASEDVLPQVLGYAIWAETNPDSIKAIWLESTNKPEDIELEWDNLEVRVIIIAPQFRATVPRMAGKIGYPIDLVQVQRFAFEGDEFLLVDFLDEEPATGIRTTKVLKEWDWDFYTQEHGKEVTQQFKKAVEELNSICQSNSWDITYNLNKYYTGFKIGHRIIFAVNWGGTHAWNISLGLPLELAKEMLKEVESWEFQRFEERYSTVRLRPTNRIIAPVSELSDMLMKSYQFFIGTV